jgi:KDO2-lipid IV(A) lauroyltransferase
MNLTGNLSLVTGASRDSEQVADLSRRIMRNFARMITEFFYMPKMSLNDLEHLVDIESCRRLKQALGDGSAMLLSAHIGNWELGATAVAMLGTEMHVVAYDHPDKRVADLFRRNRESRGLKVLPVKLGARTLRSVLRGSCLGILADRDFTGKGMPIELFGVPTTVPSAYAQLAISLCVPIIPAFCLRTEDGKYRVFPEKPIFDPDRDQISAEEIVRRFVTLTEKYVEKYPEQWYLFDRI